MVNLGLKELTIDKTRGSIVYSKGNAGLLDCDLGQITFDLISLGDVDSVTTSVGLAMYEVQCHESQDATGQEQTIFSLFF
jgi:hypothetical protein